MKHNRSISLPSFDGQLLELQSYALALSIQSMVCYSPFLVVCGAWDAVPTREVPREKNMNLKYRQLFQPKV